MSAGGSDSRHGWTIVAVLTVTETVSWGVLYYAFAVFQVPMQHELGWSKSELTGAFSLALATSALAAFPVEAPARPTQPAAADHARLAGRRC